MTAPLRDPLALDDDGSSDQKGETPSSSPSLPGPSRGSSLSLGLPRSRGGRSRGGGPSLSSDTPHQDVRKSKQFSDDAVRSTDNDALGSRLSALRAGYFLRPDPFTELFSVVPHPTLEGKTVNPPVNARPPVINLGTYLRCEGLDGVVEQFLKADVKGKGRQIVSLGAGSDARYWRLISDPSLADHLRHYLELDFPEIVARKMSSIQQFSALRSHLIEPVNIVGAADSHPGLHSAKYTLRSCDLREVTSASAIADNIFSSLDPCKPTLVIAECVLAYLPPENSRDLLDRISRNIRPDVEVAIVCYDMCVGGEREGGRDKGRFGEVMLSNLEKRGLTLVGARSHRTASSHADRLAHSLSTRSDPPQLPSPYQIQSHSVTLSSIFLSLLPPPTRSRLSSVQGLDEIEELELLLGCYCFSLASRLPVLENEQETESEESTATATATVQERRRREHFQSLIKALSDLR